MSGRRLKADRQLYLFEKRLAWHEFPLDIREEVIQLFGAMCLEIIDGLDLPAELKEQCYEPIEDQPLAP